MKIISWNVNGIRAVRKKGFNQFVSRHKPDLLCLQETKVGRDQLEDVDMSLKNYDGHFSSGLKRGYSGVGTFVREGAPFNKRGLQLGMGKKKYDDEGRVIVTNHSDFILYNIYFPSGTSGEVRQNYKYDFLADLYKHIEELPKSKRDKLIICGDYNICHKEIDIHHPKDAERLELSGFLPEEREWMDEFSELGFVDSYRHANGDKTGQYSWWSYRAGAREKNLGWRIDYHFVSKKLAKRIKTAKILPKVMGSDHAPVVLELE